MVWAASASGPVDPYGNSTALGSASRLLGALRPGAAKRKKCTNDCWGTITWVPTLPTPHWVAVRFAVPSSATTATAASAAAASACAAPAPTISLSFVRRLGVYVLNLLGALSPTITRIDLLLLLPAAQAGSAGNVTPAPSRSAAAGVQLPVAVPVFTGLDSNSSSTLSCPALNWVDVKAKAVAREAAKAAAAAAATGGDGATTTTTSSRRGSRAQQPSSWVVIGSRLTVNGGAVAGKAELPNIHAIRLELELDTELAAGVAAPCHACGVCAWSHADSDCGRVCCSFR
ncbi:hypothetical protein CHLRE_07g312600v5 [Chlamydomonas reinhardtii]|uniref:Uncharacterized protein n=1 Tax=Chlamydomonas reinhardtii TaxID=3055 RepID=A0A2K3DIF7_CHLRE|nr:uncharacterized protein CHLRE_07g312600v5 [Chlamydomonas reinhardtii]XP_042922387.1 uncharacterized protein CHLRE_07g312600v5 [Chlamydomonas reinhardtii]PNW80317.1 hypothetical protein CHLRE_07g312600v5 [Chlamydomonas reinhardtii]PNW80318.1 hypothetical protein CHLRE_07g312600v5 [Chlamydomonas reinhardtii]